MKLEGDTRDRLRLAAIAALIVGGFLAFQHFVPNLDIEGFLEDLARELGDWTYALVGLLAFLETGAFVGLVFPGETAVILGGAVAGQGETSVEITLAVVWFCAWAGDSVSFLIGTRLGREFVLRHGPKVRITRERFAQVEAYFGRHGGKTILIGRFLGLVRALAPFIAGSSGMRYRAFLPYSVLGTGLWAAAFTMLGYVVSRNLNEATEIAGTGTLVFGVLVGVVVGTVLLVRFMRVRSNRHRLARTMERHAVLRPVVALGRRIEPQARFLYARLTPGGLGLEFTSLIAVLSVALFVLIGYTSIVSVDPGPTPGDEAAFEVVGDLRAEWLTDAAKVVSSLGSVPATLAVAVVAAIALGVRRHWTEVAVLVVALAILYVAVPALKDAVDRPRPAGALVDSNGSSFPSGHAAYSVIYTWLALTITVRVRPGMTRASALIAAGIVLTALIGLSRVYLRVHYLSDVSAGWGLGVSAFAACATVAMLVPYLQRVRQNWAR
ncbi:MAG TPA: bifunctional DedA family/phosphatase PAP2 family protein [Solirubrobacterales bacterium]|nr:bifunctional DedA family/phosphatase PAP2 family protein [Solirubrobacterales bacterium]